MKIERKVWNPFNSSEDDSNNDYFICEKRAIKKHEIKDTEISVYLTTNEATIIRHTKTTIVVSKSHIPLSTVTWKGKVLQADDMLLRIELTKADGDHDTKISLYNKVKFEELIGGTPLSKGDRFIWTFETYLNDEGRETKKHHFQLLPQSFSTTEEQIEKHKKRVEKILKMLSEDENR